MANYLQGGLVHPFSRSAIARFCCFSFVAALCGVAWGQITGAGLISGTVTDPNGAVVPGASIVIKNLGTGTDLPLSTNEVGLYTAPFLQPGRYEISATKTGFAKVLRTGITLQVGQTLTIDI